VQIEYVGEIATFSGDEQGFVDYTQIVIYYSTPGPASETNWVIGTVDNELKIDQGPNLSSVPPLKITPSGNTELSGLKMSLGSGLNKILKSDADGQASWADLSSLSTDWTVTGNDLSNLNSGQVQVGGAWSGPFASSLYKLTVSGDSYYYNGINTTNTLFSISSNLAFNGSSHLKFERSYGDYRG
jgi:hypothetical protein